MASYLLAMVGEEFAAINEWQHQIQIIKVLGGVYKVH